MEYVRKHGYPVPAVEEVSTDGTELVIERLDGVTMADALRRRPWTMRRQADVLATLHSRLHDIAAPGWVPNAPGSAGDSLLHLDLHPLNVVVTGKGPVVIDWTNACRGIAEVDVALAWVLLASGEIPVGRLRATAERLGRRTLVNSFLRHFDVAAVRIQLPDVVAWKVTDANMTDVERRAMRTLANEQGSPRG